MVKLRAAGPILLATYGSPGDLQPFLAIGVALEQRGQPVLIATSSVYRERVERLGLAFAPIRPERDPDLPDPDYLERVRRGERPAQLFRDMFMPCLRESTADLLVLADGARAVVSHTLLAGARLAAEKQGVPWISTTMQPMGYLSAAEPPVIGNPLLAAGLRRLGHHGTEALLRAGRRLSGPWVRDWHDLRRELGLPESRQHPLFEGQHSALLSLGLFPRVLGEPQVDWPASARTTGFPFLRDPARCVEPDLAAFLAAGPAPITFTLGTTAVNDPGHFYDISAAAALALGQRAVLVTGPRGTVAQVDDQVITVPWAPHDLLFARSQAVVHQGGIGTLAEAMAAGKPMVIMPYAHDQADNAWRAGRLGVARVLPRHRYREPALVSALAALLDSRQQEATCRAVQAEMARERGAATAAAAVLCALGHDVRTEALAQSATM